MCQNNEVKRTFWSYNTFGNFIQYYARTLVSTHSHFMKSWKVKVFKHDARLAHKLSDSYTQRNLFWLLQNQTKFVLWLHFSDSFDTKRNSIWREINRKNVITIQIWFILTRFRKDLSLRKLTKCKIEKTTSRVYCLSASWGPNWWSPEPPGPSQHYRIADLPSIQALS